MQTAKYYYWGVQNPNFAIQIYSGNYIISDYGNNRIIEMDFTLSSILRTYSITGCVFFDYSEENETLLITNALSNSVIEITWSDLDLGTIIWQSSIILSNPQCATYRQNNVNEIAIADMGNNRIVLYDKVTGLFTEYTYYKLSEDDTSLIHEISSFYEPYRVYQYVNGDICVIEKRGRPINFATIESSSSSSSIDSSSSSSSHSSSSSSSIDSSSSSSSSSIDSSSSSSSIDSSSSSSVGYSSSSSSSVGYSSSSSSSLNNYFTIEIATTGTPQTFTLPLIDVGVYNCTVYWGDGTNSTITAWKDADKAHSYSTPGTYFIRIDGSCPTFYFNNAGDITLLKSIVSWGDIGLLRFKCYGCQNLASLPTDNSSQPLKNIDTFENCFNTCLALISVPSGLFSGNTTVTSFASCFQGCQALTTVASGLFDEATAVTTFYACFNNCWVLTSIDNLYYLFVNNLNVTTFEQCFFQDGGLGGTVEPLWDRVPEPTGTNCFAGCVSLTNFATAQAEGWA